MASKHSQRQQRNNQIRATSKLVPHLKQEQTTHPWSFLEVVDAPQWVDLSLEARSKGKDGFDSWFGVSHEHHVISLAGMNSGISWVDKSCSNKQGNQFIISKSKQCNQSVISISKSKVYQGVGTKLEKAERMRRLEMSENGHSTKVTDTSSEKRARYLNSSYRTCSTQLSLSVLHGPADIGCTLSGSSSSTSEYEPGRPFKERSLCSNISSVTSSLQASLVELKPLVNARRRGLKQFADPYGTPICGVGDGERSRSSSRASNISSLPESSHSSEAGSSTITRSGCFELGVPPLRHSLDLDQSQIARQEELQLSEESVSTCKSGASCLSQEQVNKGGVRTWEQANIDLPKNGKLEDITNANQPPRKVDLRLQWSQQSAKETVKRGFKLGSQRFVETRGSQVGSLPRKQLCSGKENAPVIKSLTTAKSLHLKNNCSPIKAPLVVNCSKTANAKYDSNRKSLGQGYHALQISQKVGHGQAASCEDCVFHSVKTSSFAQQRKRAGAEPLPVTGCTNETTRESEKNLAALVAQHNQKVGILRLQGCRKGLR